MAGIVDSRLHFAPVTEVAEAIRTRRVSSLEVVQACLRRIAEVNPTINAVVRLAGDAEDLARRADAVLAAGVAIGPLHGVPFTIKDSLDTAGIVTTVGTTGWANRVPDRDATAVARLKAAGGILLGKTNTPEFTWSDETDNLVYGRTSNPYDPTRTSGGSSGGPAAIVAAGGSPFDIGSDTGDSIRQPSHVCGIAGIKPTSGRVPRTGHTPSFRGILESLTQLGPMARRVDDLAMLLPIIAGPDGVDPHVPPAPLGDAAEVVVDTLRVAWFTDNGIHTPTPETVQAVQAAARAIGSTGARLTEVVPPGLDQAPDLWQQLVDADGKAWLARLLAAAGTAGRGSFATRDDFHPPALSGEELTDLVERIDALRSSLLRWFGDFDAIVCPAMPQPAVRHGESYQPWFADTYSDVHNLTGWPAAVVRGGTSPDGLPIGVQLVARPWREDVALAAARVVELASGGWHPPPI
jgi:amidase